MGANYTRSLTTARRLQSLQRQMGPSGTTPKRLIVLCDGTWQNSVSGERFSYPTNVTRFSRALSQFGVNEDKQKVPQIIYYQPGVGTRGLTDKFTGGMRGCSFFICFICLLQPISDSPCMPDFDLVLHDVWRINLQTPSSSSHSKILLFRSATLFTVLADSTFHLLFLRT